MVFSSILFIFYFLPICTLFYYISPNKLKNLVLLIFSLLFYFYSEPINIHLLFFVLIIDFFTMRNYTNLTKANKEICRSIAIWSNIILIFSFKYLDFFIEILNIFLYRDIEPTNVALPLGISFFTFQSLSYVFDVSYNKVKPQRNFVKFALYIFCFPQLVAGPIVRYTNFTKQINKRRYTLNRVSKGIVLFIIGVSKKVIISNRVGFIANEIFLYEEMSSRAVAWVGIICYSLQIYFDFSGYSDMAVGIGNIFGFKLPRNFNYPYISRSISEFWRRWHITLGLWFRDYVYYPLGGSRVNKIKLFMNLFIVWSLTGLWHGASWNFVVWGWYHCFFICIEKLLLSKFFDFNNILINLFKHVYVLIVVSIGWVFFRANDITHALEYIKAMFFGEQGLDKYISMLLNDNIYWILIAIIGSTPILRLILNAIYNLRLKNNIYVYWIKVVLVTVLFGVVIIELVNDTFNPFIYFNF